MDRLNALKRHFAANCGVACRAKGVPLATSQRASIKCARSSETAQAIDSAGAVREVRKRRLTRVALATTIGTAIEAFDFLAFGTAAALVFNSLFFPRFDSTAAALASFAAFATGLFARPVGAVMFGHFGDRLGRKRMLVLSLVGMGAATVIIGLLPTYVTIGLWAAVLLVVLRILQGLSVGGEMGGAVVLAVEHAPEQYKSFFGSLPQTGAPIGLLLSTSAFAAVTLLPEQDLLSWGWRLPFLASAVLIVIGLYVRRSIDESPEFTAIEAQRKTARVPALSVIRHHIRPLLLTITGKLAEVTLFYLIIVFLLSYATRTSLLSRNEVLGAIAIGALVQLGTIPLFGWLGDRVGQRLLYGLGGVLLAVLAIPVMAVIDARSVIGLKVAIIAGLGFNYSLMFGPQASLYSAQFPPELRYSGVSLGIQLAAALGGGLAPIIATALLNVSGGLVSIGAYLATLGLLATLCAWLMRAPPTTADELKQKNRAQEWP
jgi:MHS family shikimate/dehydroshikimate transporter-like MFS transporter